MSYKAALELLRDYEPKRLACNMYVTPDGVCCAIGAIMPVTRSVPKLQYEIDKLLMDGWLCKEDFAAVGITPAEADAIQTVNDDHPCDSDEDRYVRVLNWLEKAALE